MKKILISVFVMIFMLSLIGCSTSSTKGASESKIKNTEKSAIVEEKNEIEENKTSHDNEKKASESVIVENSENDTESEESQSKQTASQTTKNKATIKANGKIYSANFNKVDDLGKRDIYSSDDYGVTLEYDQSSGELLDARFKITEEPKHTITKEKAKKIAEAFITTQCDISKYDFDEIIENSSSGYFITYSKHIDGYKSTQTIFMIITYDGFIKHYSHKKYQFDGINTNVKIDEAKLNKELDKRIKDRYKNLTDYTVTHQRVDVDEGRLTMRYTVNISETDDTHYRVIHIPINQTNDAIK